MPDGIIIIDKPMDWTSMDVCAKLRGVFHEKRIGHGGTLDPMATGVLPVFVGRATRAVEFAETGEKEYLAALRLGIVTDTQDTSGRVLEMHDAGGISRADVAAVLPRFTGAIDQIPPMYSAIKINGQKLYQLARKGKSVERPARRVTIHALELLPETENTGALRLRVRCSQGTYIRTLCHSIGQALGCGAAMAALRRTEACGFSLSDAVPLAQAVAAEEPSALLRPVDSLFAHCPPLTLSAENEKKVRCGAPLRCSGLTAGEYRAYGQSGTFLALCRSDGETLTTVKSFFPV